MFSPYWWRKQMDALDFDAVALRLNIIYMPYYFLKIFAECSFLL